jgi:signal peptidase I
MFGALWLYALPLLCAVLVFRFLIPAAGLGFRGWVTTVVRGMPVVAFAAVFLLFSAITHHWRGHLPGMHEAGARDMADRKDPTWRNTAITVFAIGFGIVAVYEARVHVAEPYEILSSSMVPTLQRGDRIVAVKTAYARRLPDRGDVIVFPSASVALGAGDWPALLVKRVIGLPGDRIETHDGAPIINGWKVPYCDAGPVLYVVPDGLGSTLRGHLRVEFLGSKSYVTILGTIVPAPRAPVTVASGQLFVLGDNRSNSIDSRSWNDGLGGGVPATAILGRADLFLVGTRRSGDADWSRLFQPIDRMQAHIRLDGFGTNNPRAAVERCLSQRPAETVPPVAPFSPSVTNP